MRVLLNTLFLLLSCFAANAQGFNFMFWPNLNQYDHTGFYVNDNKMILAGSYYHPSTFRTTGVLMTSDTSATISSSWTLDEPNGWGLNNIRIIDANNSLLSGNSSVFPNSGMIAKINHTTGVVAFSKYYSANAGGFGNASNAVDAITLSNGDLAMVGSMNENRASTPCPSTLCVGPNAYGYLKAFFGSSSYGRGDDVCLIRTDGSGDSLWVKKYHLAYDNSGTFVWCASPLNGADSARNDSPTKAIELSGNIFITGFTIDYYRKCQGMTWDPQTFLLKVNSSGVFQWCKTFYIGASPQQEYGVDLAPVTSDASNDIIVLSRSDNSGNVELCRVQNATGNIVWAKSFDCGYAERGWGIKQTSDGKFIISITAAGGPKGSYDMILLKIDRDGNVIGSKGVGTSNMDGADSWAWYGPNVDAFSIGTYAIAGVSNYSGGPTGSSYVAKIPSQTFTTGCSSHEFNVTVNVINRNTGGANQLQTRTPLVYETRGGAGKGTLALASTPFVPSAVNPCLLPVELLSFSGKQILKKQVLLNWSTASELNNHYFTIERSEDGKNFIPIGTIEGSGNSNTTLHYEFLDNSPPNSARVVENGIYYRLKQTDYDGKFEYADVIMIKALEEDLFSVFINHDENNAEFSFVVYRDQKVLIELYDVLGKRLFSRELMADKGFNKTLIPLTYISNGSYLCVLITEGKKVSKKISYNHN